MFKKWYANNATNLSHVLMDGGKLSVPFDRLNEFYDVYIDAVTSGKKIYVVEQKSETYNFFVDIDYKDPEPLGIDEIQDISKVICETVKFHGGKECLISVAKPKQCGSLMKTGVHLNWPGLVVDQASAVALREHILVSLAKFNRNVEWNDIIDASVYGSVVRRSKGSGFRMPWSYKRAKHEACGARGCKDCENGQVDQGPYLPLFIYTDEAKRIDQKPSVEILKMAAVRTDQPKNVTIDVPSVKIKEVSFSPEETRNEIYDEELRSMIEDFVRKNMEGQSDAYITKLFKNKETYYAATTSRYCENVKRKHGSNHVWFIISGREILQKCFSRHETIVGRCDGFCEHFCGRRHKLATGIVDKLYPEKEDLKKCPEIKKYVEQPQVDAKPDLESFINKHMKTDGDLQVIKLTKMKGYSLAMTTSSFCENISGEHEGKLMSYIIKKNEITQKCPICKRSKARTHKLPSKITEKVHVKST
jgi:hypothetical protein